MLAMTYGVGDLLRQGRTRMQLSQRALALRIGSSNTAVQRWERDEVFPDRKFWPAIVAALPNVTLDELERLRAERVPGQVDRDDLDEVAAAMREMARALDAQTEALRAVLRSLGVPPVEDVE